MTEDARRGADRTPGPGRIVIVGGGLAGFSAAETLRAEGYLGPIGIVEAEPTFYDRPPISKELLSETLVLPLLEFASSEKLAQLALDPYPGRIATAINPNANLVRLDDGSALQADTILLATGGRPRKLVIPGAENPAVHYLRTFSDAQTLRTKVTKGSRVTIIGAGLIGAEIASSLIDGGAIVTLIDPERTPLLPAVGQIMAEHLHAMHNHRGIETVVGIPVGIEPAPTGTEVVLDTGRRISGDLIVVGVGIEPNTQLAADAGIEVNNGIIVNEMQQTSHPRVFAAGDCSRHRRVDGELERRQEHWEAAQLSGRAAAAGILGLVPERTRSPWFWTDRHGIHVEATGRLTGPGEFVTRENPELVAAFLVDNGRMAGAVSIDNPNIVRAARRIIDHQIPVSLTELADPSVSLRTLLKADR